MTFNSVKFNIMLMYQEGSTSHKSRFSTSVFFEVFQLFLYQFSYLFFSETIHKVKTVGKNIYSRFCLVRARKADNRAIISILLFVVFISPPHSSFLCCRILKLHPSLQHCFHSGYRARAPSVYVNFLHKFLL